jgi:hypothetical protein
MISESTPRTLHSGSDEEPIFFLYLYGSRCEQVRLIEPYVSRRLQVRVQTRFELHLFSCERCLRAVEFELLVKRAVGDFAKFAQFSRSWH